MFQLFAVFPSWVMRTAFIVLLNRIFKTYIWGAQSHRLSEKSELPPELVFQILKQIPFHIRPRVDVFTTLVPSSSFHSFDIAVISAPLVCSSWNGPGTAALYDRITLYSEAQCILLLRTLRENPSLQRLIRLLHLPHSREASVVTPYSVLQVSARIVAVSTLVYELDVLQQDDSLLNMSSFPNLRSLHVSNSGIQRTIPISPSATRFPVLQELTLNGYHFDTLKTRIDVVWPELRQLKSLRLEKCTFYGEGLAQILRRATPKLQSLALFSMRHPFSDIASCLEDSLEELRLENCWPRWLESNLTSYAYRNLRSLHLEWDLFVMTARFFPSNLRRISITISKYLEEYLPDYYRFETKLERLSLDLPNLEEIRVLGNCRYLPLEYEIDLRRKLSLQGVRLVVEIVRRGEDRPSWTWKDAFRAEQTGWHEWLYI